jgi:hypothetical protein
MMLDECDLPEGFTCSAWAPDGYQISADSVINSAIPITSNHAADGYRRDCNDPISSNANRSVSWWFLIRASLLRGVLV